MAKKICFFGSYNRTHRNNSLLRGLRECGHEVIECYDDSPKPLKYIKLFLKHWRIRHSYDVMMIGFPNQGLVPLARLITRRPIIFDPFISLYNTIVEDRQQKSKYSLRALVAFVLDKVSVRIADFVTIDTSAHADYFAKTFNVTRQKFIVTPVGADESIFKSSVTPTAPRENTFAVKFYGTYSPLQGVQYIVRAAKLLEHEPDIHFYLLGNGQTLAEMLTLAKELSVKNVTFATERIPVAQLPAFLETSDVCLGIFGGTIKSNMVVPHKVFDALSLGKPVLTGNTDAIREFFTNNENIIVCNEADPDDLAAKILLLKRDRVLREKVAHNGHAVLLEKFTPRQIVQTLSAKIATL